MPPPPAEPFAARIFLGPALRAQPDRRLVKLVREGYETAFEEIVRRYRKPLDRFAAAFVGGRSEDVTQDAFSKALLALRGTTTEIELKPWLYRIVRNTALNDLRDGPPATEELGEAIAGGRSAAVEAERREEIAELMERLRALPEPQRAAIVMRELEGLSHEEIAAALGVSGGAARQAIYRARLTLRDGLGMLVPLPLLRMLFDHGAEAAGAGAGAAVAATGAASAAGGGGATLGGIGAAGALKVGVATALLAGSVGAGVAMQHDHGERGGPEPAAASATQLPVADTPASFDPAGGLRKTVAVGGGEERGHGDDGPRGDDQGKRGDGPSGDDLSGSSQSGNDSGPDDSSGHSGHGGRPGHGGGSGEERSGDEASEGSHSGRRGSGHGSDDGSDRGSSGSGGHGGGSGSSGGGGNGSGSGSGGHSGGSGDSGGGGHGGSGSSDDPPPAASPPPATQPPAAIDGGSGESGPGGGDSSSGGGSSGGGEDDS
jgi:RNA polymerase sigma factor (sigma-70 family)